MMPILQPNDVIHYRKTTFSQCKTNDFIMVKKNGQLFTHRVIYKTKNYLITKGDNNLDSDGRIYPRQIIGKFYQIKRKLKESVADPSSEKYTKTQCQLK